MTKRWERRFNFYMTEMEAGGRGTAPMSIVVDLAAALHAPVQTHPLLLRVFVAMKQPRVDGLRSSEEAETLFELEGNVVTALTMSYDAIFVGQVIGMGRTEIVFYFGPSDELHRAEIEEVIKATAAHYRAHVKFFDDPGWEFYQRFLYPDVYSHNAMTNREIRQSLAERGDDGSRPRVIDFWVCFPDVVQAEGASAVLRELGFEVDPPTEREGEDGGEGDPVIGLELHASYALTETDEVCFRIIDAIDPFDGTLDGWGCSVTKADA